MLAGFLSLCIISQLCRYNAVRKTSDTITFPIPGKLSKITSSFIHDKSRANELAFLVALDGSKSNFHSS